MAKGGGVPRELVLADWNWLHETGELRASDPLQWRIREAAPRMGMTVEALGKALERAGIRNPVDAALIRRRPSDCETCRKYRVALNTERAEVRRLAYRLQRRRAGAYLAAQLEQAQEQLAKTVAMRDMHREHEHTADEVAA